MEGPMVETKLDENQIVHVVGTTYKNYDLEKPSKKRCSRSI